MESETKLELELRRAQARRQLPSPGRRRQIRPAAGASLAAMAEELGVQKPAVWKWENGVLTPRGNRLPRYVELLDRMEGGA